MGRFWLRESTFPAVVWPMSILCQMLYRHLERPCRQTGIVPFIVRNQTVPNRSETLKLNVASLALRHPSGCQCHVGRVQTATEGYGHVVGPHTIGNRLIKSLSKTFDVVFVVPEAHCFRLDQLPVLSPLEVSSGQRKLIACWQLLDVGEEGRVESPVGVEEKKIANRGFVETARDFGMQTESCDRIAKDKGRSNPGVIEKFYAEMVTCAEKPSRTT